MAKQVKSKWPITTIVEVSWYDAAARSSWGAVEEYLEHDIAPIVTSGYLLKKDKKSVTIINSQGVDFPDVNGGISIPLTWISKMKVIRK